MEKDHVLDNAASRRPAEVAYVPTLTLPCACGGFLTADPSSPGSVHWAVVRHRQTLGHQAWLAWLEASE